jgi:phenylpropionate dioxygenase-like ring-hydroxylating dioxygenase large terminal subunit
MQIAAERGFDSPAEGEAAAPLREVWYFALPGAALKRGGMLAKTILGEKLLLGRDAAGKVFAIADSCAHRGMPLSCGRFDGAEIECCYHGWRFSTEGALTAIPSLAEGQRFPLSSVRLASYPTAEIEGNVWVFFGRDPEAAPAIPQACPTAEGRLYRKSVALQIYCGLDNAVISLVDPAHGPYVHESWFWHGRATAREKIKDYRPSLYGFTMVPHATSANYRAYRLLGGKPETEIVFQLPGVRIERTRAGRNLVVNMTAMTPLEDGLVEMNHTIYWTMPWLTPLVPLFDPFIRRFVGQDKTALENQQRGLAHAAPMLLVNDADTPLKWYFRLKREFAAARREGRDFVNPVTARTLRWRT